MSEFRTSRTGNLPFPVCPVSAERDGADLDKLLAALWHGKWLIAAFTTAAILIGMHYAYFVATPLYKSTSVIIYEPNHDPIIDVQPVAGGFSADTPEVKSEVDVLRSRALLEKVADQLDLFSDPEFNHVLRHPSSLVRWKARAKRALGLTSPPVPLSPDIRQRRERDAVVTTLQGKITVSHARQSLVFHVTAEANDADTAARIADTLAAQYIVDQKTEKLQATEQAMDWFSGRVTELRRELERNEAAMAEFRATTTLVSVSGLQILEQQITELRDQIDAAERSRKTRALLVQGLETATSNDKKAMLAKDTELTRIAQWASGDASAQAAFDTRFQSVLQSQKLDLRRDDTELSALRNTRIALEAQLKQQSEDLINHQKLTRETEATRLLYEHFLARLKETSAQQGIQKADSRVLSNAVVPIRPSEPRRAMILTMSSLIGIMLGTCLVLLRELRNQRFRTARDLENFTGCTVMGQLPTSLTFSQSGGQDNAQTDAFSEEAVRRLRTSLLMHNVSNPPKVIVFTAAAHGEGKTDSAFAFAKNLSGLGKSVLFIAGDLHDASLTELAPANSGNGLSEIVNGDTTLHEAVIRPAGFGADMLLAGHKSERAADDFASDAFKRLIDQASDTYDFVLIDAPPILVTSDALILSQLSDAALLCVKWDHTTKSQISEALRSFRNANQCITGLVLSRINPKAARWFDKSGIHGVFNTGVSKQPS